VQLWLPCRALSPLLNNNRPWYGIWVAPHTSQQVVCNVIGCTSC
jgi:hypothetical protein